MTKDEALEVTATTIREATRWVFGVWKSPAAIRAAAAIQFVCAIAADEWDALENPPVQTEREQMIADIADDLRARGSNGHSEKAAETLYEMGALAHNPQDVVLIGSDTWKPRRHAKPAIEERQWKGLRARRETETRARFGATKEEKDNDAQR